MKHHFQHHKIVVWDRGVRGADSIRDFLGSLMKMSFIDRVIDAD